VVQRRGTAVLPSGEGLRSSDAKSFSSFASLKISVAEMVLRSWV